MQCRYCGAPMADNSTVCANCGKSSARKTGPCCDKCGSAFRLKAVNKFRPQGWDWLFMFILFPIGFLITKTARTRVEFHCHYCGQLYTAEEAMQKGYTEADLWRLI